MTGGGQTRGRDRLSTIVLVSLLGIAVAAISLAHPAHPRSPARAAILTPVVLRRALTRAPALWIGRTLWVRARAVPVFAWTCQHDVTCVVRQPSLADPTVDAGDAALPLLLPPASPLWTLLARMPVIGGLVRQAQAIPWGTVALYQIQVRVLPACSAANCIAALLVGGSVTGPAALQRPG